jgi:hypothetical protein
MRTTITITQVCILEKHISVKATCLNITQIKPGLLCSLQISRNDYVGKIASTTENDNRISINLKIERRNHDDDANTLRSLLPFQYTDKELALLLEEKVESDLLKEAEVLLYRLSQKTARKPEEVLLDLTAFKPGVGGRTDLRFVSQKQMLVLVDKMTERLSEQHENSF